VEGLAGGYGDIQVLWDVSLTVDPGSVTVVLGRNGAGKTSLLNAVAGLLPTVRSGRISFEGRDIRGLNSYDRIRSGLAYVQEGKRIFRRRSVEENLLLGGYTVKRPLFRRGQQLTTAVELAYERFPMLAERKKLMAGRLSGGQQQMLAIAQALIPGPRVVMLDEPSAGLAPVIAKEVFALVGKLREDGLAVLLVEQVIEQAMGVADRVVVIESGRVATTGRVAEFDDLAVVRDLYLGRSNPSAEAELRPDGNVAPRSANAIDD
jgi:branched-chain amino acid transport system ATP-binding protein